MAVLARHLQFASYQPAPARLSPPQLNLAPSPPALLVKNLSSTRLDTPVLDVVPLARNKPKQTKKTAVCYVIACDQSENAISDTEETPQHVVLNYAARRAKNYPLPRPQEVQGPIATPVALAKAPKAPRGRGARVRFDVGDNLEAPSASAPTQAPISPITVSPPTSGTASSGPSSSITEVQAPIALPPAPAPAPARAPTATAAKRGVYEVDSNGEPRGPIWLDSVHCNVRPRGCCTELQTPYSPYCPKHACQAINEDGRKCGNMVKDVRERYCKGGFHDENRRLKLLDPLKENRLRQNIIDAERRLDELQDGRRWLQDNLPGAVDLPPIVGTPAMNQRVPRDWLYPHNHAVPLHRPNSTNIWDCYEPSDWIGGMRLLYPQDTNQQRQQGQRPIH